MRPQLGLVFLCAHVILTCCHHHVLEAGIERGHFVTVNICRIVNGCDIESIAGIIFHESSPVWVRILLVAPLAGFDACGGEARHARCVPTSTSVRRRQVT